MNHFPCLVGLVKVTFHPRVYKKRQLGNVTVIPHTRLPVYFLVQGTRIGFDYRLDLVTKDKLSCKDEKIQGNELSLGGSLVPTYLSGGERHKLVELWVPFRFALSYLHSEGEAQVHDG